MIEKLFQKLFGTKNERELKKIQPILQRVNSFEESIKKLTDEKMREKTQRFKVRLDGAKDENEKKAMLDEILPEAFALVREASVRTLGMRPFDVQVIGAIILHQGRIAEMKTGEGKTLVATMPVYLNSLLGKGVHVVTVNDYLARRDAEWMGKIYRFLGLSVGVIVHGLTDKERREAYYSDVTYGTNNEFGFDYLRDNMKYTKEDQVQRGHYYAIVDEVDSILIDEARTPLIISGPSEESSELYYRINDIIPALQKDIDFTIDEKSRTAALTEEGNAKVEKRLGIRNLYEPENMEILHHVLQALKAHNLFKRDRDYVVKDGEVIIVDEFTGRLMPGRRWSDGLHQAIEAKERVKIEEENQTLATITFQKYFLLYEKLAGMTGTAKTEEAEFQKIYNVDVVVIPTNKEMIRIDYPDVIYKTEKAKFRAVVNEIEELHRKGRPVLVGTVSIEKSELLSKLLKIKGIKHHVLNAKHHEREAEIIAQAGRVGAVTISTNMAGRGTDILLGGNPEFLAKAKVGREESEEKFLKALEEFKSICEEEKRKVISLGGLHIIGTERHEARRIDNQLRGRAGRQGDPGSSRFYLSLQDDLMRIFGSDRISSLMDRFGMEEDIPIEHKWVTKAIENAQKKVEAHNFSIRKNLFEYDDVMSMQRDTVYRIRKQVLEGEGTRDLVLNMIEGLAERLVNDYLPAKAKPEELDVEGLRTEIRKYFGFEVDLEALLEKGGVEEVLQETVRRAKEFFNRKEEEYTPQVMRQLERYFILRTLDHLWRDQLLAMDHLREGIGLRGYGQRDPILEYKKEGFHLFSLMENLLEEQVVMRLFRVRINPEDVERLQVGRRRQQMVMNRGEGGGPQRPFKREGKKIGRNDPCPCGSGKKYKKCCMLKEVSTAP